MDNIWTELRHHWQDSAKKERPQRESWADPGMQEIAKLTNDLKNDHGWRSAAYCPKDGSIFLAWTPECGLPFACAYRGKWPDGKWDAYESGDVWPMNPGPVLWKPMPDRKQR